MVHHVHPRLVEEFRIAEEVKKGGSGGGKGKARASTPSGDDDYRAIGSNSPVRTPSQLKRPSNKKPQEPNNNYAPQQVGHTFTSSVLDPWFLPDITFQRSSSTSSDGLSPYFFCSENPDDLSVLDPAQDTGLNVDEADHDEDDTPQDRFNDMFDKIMGISESPSRPKKVSAPKRSRSRMLDGNFSVQLQSNSARTAKRAKITHSAPSSFPDLSLLQQPARPSLTAKSQNSSSDGVIDLSDSEDMTSDPSKRKSLKSASTVKRTGGRRYQAPSSQGLFLSDIDVIVDLA